MTLNEVVSLFDINSSDPTTREDSCVSCCFALAGILRSWIQREPATFDGECATLLAMDELMGSLKEPTTIRRFINGMGPDLDVPDEVIKGWMNAREAEYEEELPDDKELPE